MRHIRKRWPKTRILFRGDGHYARPEAMAWCEEHGVDYVFGLPGTKPLSKKVDETADAVRTERAVDDKDVVRGYAETRHRAKSWDRERRAIARIEATRLGLDIRFVVTNLADGSAEWLYDSLYCARGQAENLIKLHKSQLASDRTSCRSPIANQVRLVLHTGAYWLMLTVRDAIPKTARSGEGRVRDIAPAADQDRRPRHRDGQPRAPRLRRRLSRSRSAPRSAWRARAAGAMKAGAAAPSTVPSPPARLQKS